MRIEGTCLIQIWQVLAAFDVRRPFVLRRLCLSSLCSPLNTISSCCLYTFVAHPALVVRVGCMVCVCARARLTRVYIWVHRWWKERARAR